MKRSTVLKLIYKILTDNKVHEKFCMTSIYDNKDNVVASYIDCLKLVQKLYIEASEKTKVEVMRRNGNNDLL